jgi:hypothetical protein
MAATINGKRRRSGFLRLPSPPSLCSYLNSRSSSCAPLCTRSTPTRALEHQFPRRRHLCFTPPPDAVGEVHRRPILSFSEHDRLPHVTLVVQGSCPRDRAAPGARVPACRSAARATAVVGLLHRRVFFVFVFAQLFYAQ